jgi:hypothetical protein
MTSKLPTKLLRNEPKMAAFCRFSSMRCRKRPKIRPRQELLSLCHFFSQGGKHFTDELGVGQAGIAVDLQTEGKEPEAGG